MDIQTDRSRQTERYYTERRCTQAVSFSVLKYYKDQHIILRPVHVPVLLAFRWTQTYSVDTDDLLFILQMRFYRGGYIHVWTHLYVSQQSARRSVPLSVIFGWIWKIGYKIKIHTYITKQNKHRVCPCRASTVHEDLFPKVLVWGLYVHELYQTSLCFPYNKYLSPSSWKNPPGDNM